MESRVYQHIERDMAFKNKQECTLVCIHICEDASVLYFVNGKRESKLFSSILELVFKEKPAFAVYFIILYE